MNKNLIYVLRIIQNGITSGLKTVTVTDKISKSNLCLKVLISLKKEGFIKSFQYTLLKKNIIKFEINLRYLATNKNVIKNITLISKPGKRVYSSIKTLWNIKTNTNIFFLSTSKGIITDKDARLKNLSGEILFCIN
uniref:Ribosomal protein S8 n=1 Tax=Cafileria marina TaxID=2557541 RepID=A0A5B9ILS1_9STRA|nr:ribosomal protein S8 [Cafileria marina]QEF30259.1 ribosomal protein S8 [Cafileria marina]